MYILSLASFACNSKTVVGESQAREELRNSKAPTSAAPLCTFFLPGCFEGYSSILVPHMSKKGAQFSSGHASTHLIARYAPHIGAVEICIGQSVLFVLAGLASVKIANYRADS